MSVTQSTVLFYGATLFLLWLAVFGIPTCCQQLIVQNLTKVHRQLSNTTFYNLVALSFHILVEKLFWS